MRTINGHLEFIPHDGYYFMLDDTDIPDDYEIVRMADGDTREPPLMTPMAITLDEEQYIVDWNVPMGIMSADESASVIVCLGRFVDENSTDDDMVKQQAIAEEMAVEVEHYYRYESKDTLDIKVHGYAIKYNGTCNPPLFAKSVFDAYIAANDIEIPFTHYHGWGADTAQNYCGLASLDGRRGATYSGCGGRTIRHELGHNFGLLHAGLLKADGEEDEYGDTTSIMGSRQKDVESHHAQHLAYKKWIEKQLLVTSSRQVLLDPPELPEVATHTHQIAIIREAGQPDYAVSIRKGIGTPYPQEVTGRVYVHRVDKEGKSTKRLGTSLPTGYTQILPSGTTIEHLEFNNEISRVEIKMDDSLIPTLVIPTGFPPIQVVIAPMERRHTGAWYDKKYSGQGFNLFVKDGTAVLFWYTYDDRLPIYYVANGPIVDGVANLTVNKTANGTFDNPIQRTEFTVGQAQLYFTPSDRGVFQFNLPGTYGRGAVVLEPVVLASSEDTGAWWQPSLAGSGFGLMFFDDMCAGYWYTFDDQRKHRWFILLGELQGELQIYEYFGGEWMYYTKPTEKPAGTAELTKIPQGWNITYDLQATGLVKTGTQVLTSRF